MATFVESLLAGFVGGGAGAATVIYLTKRLLDHKLAQDLHGYTTRYTRLDRQRTDAILQLHGMMCEIEDLLIWASGAEGTAIVSRTPEKRTMEALNKAWEGTGKLSSILGIHMLLLPDEVHGLVHDWAKEAMTVISEIGNQIEPKRKAAEGTEGNLEEREEFIRSVRNQSLDAHIPNLRAIRQKLEVHFHKALGTK